MCHQASKSAKRWRGESLEKPLLEMVLEETGGNRIKAANVLGINRNTLRTKLKELGVETLRPARPRRKPTRR